MNPEARKYLAAIGAKGGKASRRTLTKAQAQAMVKAREAKRNRQPTLPATPKKPSPNRPQ